MSIATLSLFLDVLILLGLVATIYFALKLSRSLRNFRKQRKQFESMMRELSDNIDKAHASLMMMRGGAGSFEADIGESLGEARALLDELKMMNQSGNNLADRLEQLASRSRYSQASESYGDALDDDMLHENNDEDAFDEAIYGNIAALEKHAEDDQAFSIQDRDFDSSSAPSQAEQELVRALKHNKRQSR